MEKWTQYRDSRRGTYEFRARTRYKAVADRLFAMGLNGNHAVCDVGGGTCQFGAYLASRGFVGEYLPIDAVLDGTDLETWEPDFRVDYVVCIEVLEHLQRPWRLVGCLQRMARRGVVLTTPNAEAVDVIRCDPTHVSVLEPNQLSQLFTVERHSWFGVPNDSLLAWRQYDPH